MKLLSSIRKQMFVLWLPLILISMSGVWAQQGKRQTMTFDVDSAFLIPGLGAVILAQDGKLIVGMMPPSEALPKELREIDLQKGDEVLMINGKKMKSIAELREFYEAQAVGDTLSFGLKNEEGMRISSFAKPDEKMSGGRMMVMTETIGDGEGGDYDDIIAMPDASLLIGEKDGMLLVAGTINIGGEEKSKLSGDLPEEGDKVVAINGKAITKFDQFADSYDAITNGTEVKIAFERNGKKMSCSFIRQEKEGGWNQIKKQNK